jgi:hypothetical protein
MPIETLAVPSGIVTNITPFTYRDGATYLEILEGLRKYINQVIVPFVNESILGLEASWDADKDEIAQILADAKIYIDAKIIEATEAATAAEAAAERAEAAASDIPEMQDAAITAIFNDLASQFRIAIEAEFIDQAELQPVIDALGLKVDKTVFDAEVAAHDADIAAIQSTHNTEKTRVNSEIARLDAKDVAVDAEIDRLDAEIAAGGIADEGLLLAVDLKSQAWDVRIDPDKWNGPVGQRITLPTHVVPATNQVTHPSILFFPEKWNGYRYWMAYTPYPGGNDDEEDPNLAVSNDGVTWVKAPGVTQPLDNASGTPMYNSDPDLVMGPDATMYLFWRHYDDTAVGAEEKAYVRTSTDGVNWAAKKLVWTFNQATLRPLSPSYLFESNKWIVYFVDNSAPSAPIVKRAVSLGVDPTAGWNAPTTCTVSNVPSGKSPWHIEIARLGGQYVGLLACTDTAGSGANGIIMLITSELGTNWIGGGESVIPMVQSGEHDQLYRASFFPEVKDGVLGLRVYYAAWVNNPPPVWNIYRTWIGPAVTHREFGVAVVVGSVGAIAGSTAGNLTFPVTFARPFNNIPLVLAQCNSGRLHCAVTVLSTTGFTLRFENYTDGIASGVTVNWLALEA